MCTPTLANDARSNIQTADGRTYYTVAGSGGGDSSKMMGYDITDYGSSSGAFKAISSGDAPLVPLYKTPSYTTTAPPTAPGPAPGAAPGTAAPTAPPPSPYASNFGYGTARPQYAADEAAWYQQNNYGDPFAMSGDYYIGVSQEARGAYLKAAEEAAKIADASRKAQASLAIPDSGRVGTNNVSYTYAGDALAIPK